MKHFFQPTVNSKKNYFQKWQLYTQIFLHDVLWEIIQYGPWLKSWPIQPGTVITELNSNIAFSINFINQKVWKPKPVAFETIYAHCIVAGLRRPQKMGCYQMEWWEIRSTTKHGCRHSRNVVFFISKQLLWSWHQQTCWNDAAKVGMLCGGYVLQLCSTNSKTIVFW